MDHAVRRVSKGLALLTGLVLACGQPAGCRSEPATVGASPVPERPIPRPASVRDYRNSGQHSYWEAQRVAGREARWTPEEVVQLLEQHPDFYLDMGIWTGRPTGHADHVEVGRVVNEAQKLAAERGVDASRFLIQWRNDVTARMNPGWGCGDHCGWEGIREGQPFDPAWIVTVPHAEHRWALEQRWGGDPTKDPFGSDSEDQWPTWMDRAAMQAPNTAERVVALYGAVQDRDPSKLGQDMELRVSGVIMDLRNPAYRAWSIRGLVADLRVMGIDPGEPAVLLYAYKPGWHAYYAGGRNPRQSCFVPDGRAWTGPAGPCLGPRRYDGGPFHRTSYGPGEFERALNAMMREMRAGLVAAGYERVHVVTVERPEYGVRYWSTLDPDIRSAPWLLGELGAACHRHDPSEAPDPIRCGRIGAALHR